MTTTNFVISRDIVPLLRERGFPEMVDPEIGQELLERLEAAPLYRDRENLNNELVALQEGEVPGAPEGAGEHATRLSFLVHLHVCEL